MSVIIFVSKDRRYLSYTNKGVYTMNPNEQFMGEETVTTLAQGGVHNDRISFPHLSHISS